MGDASELAEKQRQLDEFLVDNRELEAINARQTSYVVALASVMGLTLLVTNLVLDIAYRLLDPRLRELA